MPRRKLKKSIVAPLAIGIYAAAMTLYFGPRLIAEGQAFKLWISVAVEVVFIVGLFFALRRKEKLAATRP